MPDRAMRDAMQADIRAAIANQDKVHFWEARQSALRPVGTQFWLLFDARVPSASASGGAYKAFRVQVRDYRAVCPSGRHEWVLSEGFDYLRDGDHYREYPVTAYRLDDRGWYTDYPPEWAGLLKDNEGSYAHAMSAVDVVAIIRAALAKGDAQ